MKEIDDGWCKYLGIPHGDKVKQTAMKETFLREYKQILTVALKLKRNRKNKILAISTLAVSVLQYSAGVI